MPPSGYLLYKLFYRVSLFHKNAQKPWNIIRSYFACDSVPVTYPSVKGLSWVEAEATRKAAIEAVLLTPDQVKAKAQEHKPTIAEVLCSTDLLDAPAEYSGALAAAQKEHGAVTELIIFDAWRDLNPETNHYIDNFQYAAKLYHQWVKLLGLAEAERLLFYVEKDY